MALPPLPGPVNNQWPATSSNWQSHKKIAVLGLLMPGDGPLMVGDGPLVENHTNYGFSHFMGKLYVNNRFNGLIDFFHFGLV